MVIPTTLLVCTLLALRSAAAFTPPGVGQALLRLRAIPAMPAPQQNDCVVGTGRDSLVVTHDTTITGNLIGVGHGAVVLRNATLTVRGDILLTDTASFTSQDGTLAIPQDYLYERTMAVTGRALARFTGGAIAIDAGNANATVRDDARCELRAVRFSGSFFTMSVAGRAAFVADSCPSVGEFLFLDSSTSTFRHSGMIIAWPWFDAGQQADLTFPDTSVAAWSFPDSARSATGIGYRMQFDSCRNIFWMILESDGADLTIHDSRVRAIGMFMRGDDAVALGGLANGASFDDWTYPDTSRRLRLVRSSVTTWNYYPFERTHLALSHCIFGELLAAGASTVTLTTSTCDGSGGYFSATDSAHVTVTTSTMQSQVVARLRGSILCFQSTIWMPGAASGITAESAGSILLANCSFNALPRAFDTALVIVAGVDPPGRVAAGSRVDLPGGAAIIGGPQSPVHFRHFGIYLAPAGSANWTPLQDIVTTPVVRGTLATWQVPPVTGDYLLQVCIAHNLGDSLCVTAATHVDPASGVDDAPAASAALRLFPQPAHDAVTIATADGAPKTIIITDVLGRTVRRIEAAPPATTIDLTALPPGVYTVAEWMHGDTQNRMRFLVQ